MPQRPLPERVDALEVQVTRLEKLPQHIDALRVEVSDLRNEMREGFSATRSEMDRRFETLRTHMLVLHEEVLDRISRLDEGRRPRKKP